MELGACGLLGSGTAFSFATRSNPELDSGLFLPPMLVHRPAGIFLGQVIGRRCLHYARTVTFGLIIIVAYSPTW